MVSLWRVLDFKTCLEKQKLVTKCHFGLVNEHHSAKCAVDLLLAALQVPETLTKASRIQHCWNGYICQIFCIHQEL